MVENRYPAFNDDHKATIRNGKILNQIRKRNLPHGVTSSFKKFQNC